MRDFSELKEAALVAEASYRRAAERVKEEEIELDRSTLHEEAAVEAGMIVQAVAQKVQQEAHDQIVSVVSHCLASVFTDAYQFVIHFERKRGKTEARLAFTRGGNELAPADVGGGVVDIAAFALRIACMMLVKPPVRRLICADEPLRNLNGEENRQRAAALLLELPEALGVQLILATGYPWLHIGKVVLIEK